MRPDDGSIVVRDRSMQICIPDLKSTICHLPFPVTLLSDPFRYSRQLHVSMLIAATQRGVARREPSSPDTSAAVDAPVVSIAVVIPAYRVAAHVRQLVEAVPPGVRHIVVVDDASPDDLQAVLATIPDARLTVVRHTANRGVGGALKSGIRAALDLGAGIVVKIDGDGQMDPALLPQFVAPILEGRADLTKGNRFDDLAFVRDMPPLRRAGNLALSFLVKLASGYWSLFDPCNGYVAMDAALLRRLNLERLDDRYFFEISLLCEAYHARAVLQDIPMKPVYAGEPSSLNPLRSVADFAPRLVRRALRRIGISYFMRDFNVVSVFLTAGVPSLLFGVAWSAYHWMVSIRSQVVASTGTVVIGLLGIVLGFQLLLQAVVLDVGNEPRRSS